MIFGKSSEEKREIRLQKIKNIISFGFKKFAWKPVKLFNGRYIFLEWYHAYLPQHSTREDWWISELSTKWLWTVSYNYTTYNYTLSDALILKLKE